jgi:peptidoglycan/LPS O-acetylase OafA/YrhL
MERSGEDVDSVTARSVRSRRRILAVLNANGIAGRASSYHLDAIRGVAAFVVFFSHVRHVFYIDFHELKRATLVDSVAYGLTNLGHEAVIIFFVLSGFLIGASVLRLECEGRWSWSGYIINRVSRLHVVLIPALLLGLLWDQCGMRFTSGQALYSGQVTNSVLNVSIRSRESVSVFLGNLLCLQTVLVPTFGSNSPLWSLANEFWYYMIFPLVVFAFVPWTSVRVKFVSLSVIGLLLCSLGTTISLYFPIWLMGVLINFAPPLASELRSLVIVGSALALCVILSILGTRSVNGLIADLCLGLSCAVFIYATIQDRRELKGQSLYARVSGEMAKCSYTLYLMHMPLLAFIYASCMEGTQWAPTARSLLTGLGVALLVFGYALVVAFLTERRTHAVRKWLLRCKTLIGSERLRGLYSSTALRSLLKPNNSV